MSLRYKRPLEAHPDFLIHYNGEDTSSVHKSEFEWIIHNKSLGNLKDVAIAVEKCIFSNTAYPIDTYNNKLYVTEVGVGSAEITIDEGNYDGNSMASTLETLLNAAVGLSYTYTVVYDTSSKKLTLTHTGGSIMFETGVYNIYRELGVKSTEVDNAQSSPWTFGMPVSLQGTDFIYLTSSTISAENMSTTISNNVIEVIPVDVPYGAIVNYQPQNKNWHFTTISGLNHLIISLWDKRSRRYELPENASFMLSLHIRPIMKG